MPASCAAAAAALFSVVLGACGPAAAPAAPPADGGASSSASQSAAAFGGHGRLAFVHGRALASASTSQAVLRAWYATRRLWTWIGIGGNPLPVTRAGTGVAAPAWSADGQYILYVRDNALWLIRIFQSDGRPAATAPERIAAKLFPGAWPSYYGYTAWRSQFAWYG